MRKERQNMNKKILSLRMERQHFVKKANEEEYKELYRDLQPGQNVYWNGFGQPPTLSFRVAFDDIEFNGERQGKRELVKGRFASGNLGWIVPEEMELFAALYRKPLNNPTWEQEQILHLIEKAGPFTIQQLKEETGMLVKQITPILHRLQEAFLIYEDQYDGEWDRGWYRFEEMFPDVKLERYTRLEALKIVLQRFAYRMVWFDTAMAKSFYKIPEKEIKVAVALLVEEGLLVAESTGYLLASDVEHLKNYEAVEMHIVYPIHRNDILYKAQEHILKEKAKVWTEGLDYDHEPLQYLLIDGEFHGASVGHFRNGPYDLNDVVCDLPDAERRRTEIVEAIRDVNYGKMPERFMGKKLVEE
ncbi:MAG: hypothetical protein IKL22_06990 [Lachnospiraceae bacterium]|nr:hypothetical protein [Lachnospiraceae bacterium]